MDVAARILLRVLAGYLIAKGLPPDLVDLVNDPSSIDLVNAVLGGAVWAVAEGWYWLARKLGWRT